MDKAVLDRDNFGGIHIRWLEPARQRAISNEMAEGAQRIKDKINLGPIGVKRENATTFALTKGSLEEGVELSTKRGILKRGIAR